MLLFILNIIAIANFICYICLLLFIKQFRSRANTVLALMIFNAILTLILNMLMYYQKLNAFSFMVYIAYLYEFLWGPVLYNYIQLILADKGNGKYINNKIWHFTFFFFVAFFFIWFAFQERETKQYFIVRLQSNDIPWQFLVINYISTVQFFYFMMSGYMKVKKYNSDVRNNEKNKSVDLVWFQNFFLISFLLCIVMYIPITFSANLSLYLTIIPCASLILYFLLIINAIGSPLIYSKVHAKNDVDKLVNKIEDVEEKFLEFDPNLANEFEIILEVKCVKERLYLNSELNIQTLADVCNTKVHFLSAFINQYYNKTFPDYINYYRIEEAKKLLVDPKYSKYSIDVIVHSCGFSSRSAFYRAFKKNTELTPIQYINSIAKSS